jgi:N-methylhydantoinase A
MAEAIRQLTTYRGIDPRDFGLIAYGAAGPLVATQVARSLQMPRVVIPALAGVFSAFGLLEASAFAEDVEPVMDIATEEVMADVFAKMRSTAVRLVDEVSERDSGSVHAEFVVDAMYVGQRWDLPAIVDPTRTDCLAHLKAAFDEAHTKQFGYSLPAEVHISTVRTRAVATGARTVRPALLTVTEPGRERARREIVIGGRSHPDVPVYRVGELEPGQQVTGPAVLESTNYTGLLVSGDQANINEFGDIVVEILGATL